MKNIALLFAGLLTIGMIGCQSEGAKKAKVPALKVDQLHAGIEPCEDFFAYSNENWIQENPIPSTESRWGNFNILFEENNQKLKSIIERVCIEQTSHNDSLVAALYLTAMDTDRINQNGVRDIQTQRDLIQSIKSLEDLAEVNAYLQAINVQTFFGYYVDADSKNSNENITYIYQAGLGLPAKDYYIRDDEKGEEIRKKYRTHIAKTLHLSGYEDNVAVEIAEDIYNLEYKLAEACLGRAEARDVEKTYNKMSVSEFAKIIPSINWNNYIQKIGSAPIEELVIDQPEYLARVESILNESSLELLKLYMEWHLLYNYASYLSDSYQELNFNFKGKVLRGTKEMKPRWKRTLSAINSHIGEPLGQLYVAENFSPESKQRVGQMVENIKAVFQKRLKSVDWMSDETKERAIAKLSTFKKKIGYPDVWKDYSSLKLNSPSFAQNLMLCNEFEFNQLIKRIGQPVNKDEWHMSPQTVNAYYSPSGNEIVFPSAILQPPFFNPDADDAVNYGAIGAIIGHEFSHGFDDQGSKFDGEGNMNDWWTDEDRRKFEERTKLIADQFYNLEALDSVFVDGKLTLGENIADLGGITLAYHALLKANEKNPPADIDGFDFKQRFFLGYAQVWRGHMTDAEQLRRIKTDPHSPPRFRVNAPLSNLNEFQHAFGCSGHDEMVRPDSIKPYIW